MVSARFSRLLVAVCLAASAFGATVPAFKLQEARTSAPSTFARVSAAPSEQVLSMRINLAMNDRNGLEARLMEAATPGSASFRQWLSKDEVRVRALKERDRLLTFRVRRLSPSPSLRRRPPRRLRSG